MSDEAEFVLDFLGSPMGGAAAGIASVLIFGVPIELAAGIGIFFPLPFLAIRHL